MKYSLIELFLKPFYKKYTDETRILIKNLLLNFNLKYFLGHQGNKGWWRFEERQHDDIEQSYLQGIYSFKN